MEGIILSEFSHVQKAKVHHVFLSYVEYRPNINTRNMKKKTSYTKEREGKRKKLRRSIWLMYFLYKNEYKLFKPVEITIRKGLR
jgi:hypothetical protein